MNDVGGAYSARATEYIELLGSVDVMHPSDRELIGRWDDQLVGQAIDAGCGPGHWTNFLSERGVDIRGVDLVPEFVDHARRAYPDLQRIEILPTVAPIRLRAAYSTSADVGDISYWVRSITLVGSASGAKPNCA